MKTALSDLDGILLRIEKYENKLSGTIYLLTM